MLGVGFAAPSGLRCTPSLGRFTRENSLGHYYDHDLKQEMKTSFVRCCKISLPQF